MTLGEVFLESISTGVITIQEMAWVVRTKTISAAPKSQQPSDWAA